jgi:hypothetical protein
LAHLIPLDDDNHDDNNDDNDNNNNNTLDLSSLYVFGTAVLMIHVKQTTRQRCVVYTFQAERKVVAVRRVVGRLKAKDCVSTRAAVSLETTVNLHGNLRI